MSTEENLASSTIAEGPSRTTMRGIGEQTDDLPANTSLIALDDCKCPICLDYFIDVRSMLRRGNKIYLRVVETRCNHRFCRFCLENWLRVSIHRQCPTCRTNVNVGTIHIASHLQDLINATIHPIIGEDVIRERRHIRLERQAQVERFATQREQTQALLARITSTSPRSRHIRRGRRLADVDESTSSETGPNLLTRRIMNWWDDNNSPQAATGGDPLQGRRVEEIYESDVEDLPYGVFRQIRPLNQNLEVSPSTQEGLEPPNWNMTPRSNNGMRESQREHRRGTTPTQFDQSYHESLMEEYSYHLRRVNSAHTRIREAYRDFNYHNGRMQEILGEHRSFFATNGRGSENVPVTPDEDHVVTYADFEDLMGAEMGELLDNSPAAQVVFGRLATGSSLGLGSVEMPHNLPNGLRYSMFGRGVDSRARATSTNRSSRGSSRRRYSHLNNEYESSNAPRTNVIDMEHEIRSRRNQLSRLSSLIRQCPWNSDSRYPRGGLNSQVDNGSNTSAPVSNPMQYLNPVSEADLSGMEDIRNNNQHQHQVMIERLTERTNTTSPSAHSRRMRRRLARTNIFRPSDLIRARNDSITFNGTPRAGNSFSENLLPGIIALGETAASNAENDHSRGATFANVRSENQVIIDNSVGNNMGRNFANIISSPGWAMNGSSDSEEERPTRRESRRSFRRRTSRSPQQIRSQRTLSVPPRSRSHASFRRKVRFQRRQLDNQDTNGVPTIAAAATTTSHYNTSLLQGSTEAENRLNELLNTTPEINNTEEPDDRNGNQDTRISLNDSGTENDSDVLSNSIRGRSSMSNFLKTICNKFKTR